MEAPGPVEAVERIMAAVPEGWTAAEPQFIRVDGAAEIYYQWRVVFSRVASVRDADDELSGLRTIDVDAIGRNVEDIISVAGRLPTIEEAVSFRAMIDVEVSSSAV